MPNADVNVPVPTRSRCTYPSPRACSTKRFRSTNQPVPYTRCAPSAGLKWKEHVLVARRHRVPYVHVPVLLSLSVPLLWSRSRCRERRRRRRRGECRVCFRTRRRPIRRLLVTRGTWHVDGHLLWMTVCVRVRMSVWVEPRLGSRLEHVIRNPAQLVAMCWQMRVRKTLRLCRMGQDIRRGPLLGKRLGWVRV